MVETKWRTLLLLALLFFFLTFGVKGVKERKKRETQNTKPSFCLCRSICKINTQIVYAVRRQTCTLVSRERVRERVRELKRELKRDGSFG